MFRAVRILLAIIFIPAGALATTAPDDDFIHGYAAAVLERDFGIDAVGITVRDGRITLPSAGLGGADPERISEALLAIDGVVAVELATPEKGSPDILPNRKLFAPLLADPRWARFSVAYQYHIDDDSLRNVGATSFGESFGLIRGPAPVIGGTWQLSIQAAVFAVFDLDANSKDLINADYWVGFPVSYRNGDLSALFRIFHQSSHLGDEYLLRNRVDRVNLSYEAADLKLSWDVADPLRLYAGAGYLLRHEPDDLQPGSVQYGAEFKSPWSFWNERIRPVAALDIQKWEENDWDTDLSLRIGVELSGARRGGHTVAILAEYFNGYSPNGQFYNRAVETLGIGAHFQFK